MKKFLVTLALAAASLLSIADSQANGWDHRYPERPRSNRIITVTGEGGGGTSDGNRDSACYRAEDRALYDVSSKCAGYRGYLLDSRLTGSCYCSRVSGSRDDYKCRQSAVGSCEIRR